MKFVNEMANRKTLNILVYDKNRLSVVEIFTPTNLTLFYHNLYLNLPTVKNEQFFKYINKIFNLINFIDILMDREYKKSFFVIIFMF